MKTFKEFLKELADPRVSSQINSIATKLEKVDVYHPNIEDIIEDIYDNSNKDVNKLLKMLVKKYDDLDEDTAKLIIGVTKKNYK